MSSEERPAAALGRSMRGAWNAGARLVLYRSAYETETVVPEGVENQPSSSVARAIATRAAATVGTAWMSEIMVGALAPMMRDYALSDIFVGVFVVAILANAAEHASAITAAMRNRVDLSFSIAVGSSVQVALFVAPVLVLASLRRRVGRDTPVCSAEHKGVSWTQALLGARPSYLPVFLWLWEESGLRRRL
ncbi:hypothetical protein AB4Z48_33580 [Cupriavidus sp. 2TAF22]|uniref:hypothetical protein n=1 Tax=unclassified Cupriavidus TaxID=2640874 RepID=UPI003F932E82